MAKQTFKVAGITTHNGNTKVRFTDDMVRRIKQFTKGGASRIDLVELPSEMTKIEALNHIATLRCLHLLAIRQLLLILLMTKQRKQTKVQ
jgi:hypothetical protein